MEYLEKGYKVANFLHDGMTNPSDQYPEGLRYVIQSYGETQPMFAVRVGAKKDTIRFDIEEAEILMDCLTKFLNEIGGKK